MSLECCHRHAVATCSPGCLTPPNPRHQLSALLLQTLGWRGRCGSLWSRCGPTGWWSLSGGWLAGMRAGRQAGRQVVAARGSAAGAAALLLLLQRRQCHTAGTADTCSIPLPRRQTLPPAAAGTAPQSCCLMRGTTRERWMCGRWVASWQNSCCCARSSRQALLGAGAGQQDG